MPIPTSFSSRGPRTPRRKPRAKRPLLWLALGSLVVLGCATLEPVDVLNGVIPRVGYTLESDVVYGNESRQRLDIYHPTDPAETSRLVVFIYGGAWRDGEKSDYEFVGQALSAAGHTVVIPDFRLYPETRHPTMATDVALAIESLTSLSSLPDAAPDGTRHIVLMGHSSGAHTAALLAADAHYLASSNVVVDALVALAGPYDLPMDDPEVIPVFAGTSPDEVIVPRLVTTDHPVSFLAHGLDDERVVPRHTRRYAMALRDADVPVSVHLPEKAGHAGILAGLAAPLRFTSPIRQDLLDFLADPSGDG